MFKLTGQTNRKLFLLKMVAIVLPAIVAGLIAIFYGISRGVIPLPMPQWNDEAAYYAQVKMWLAGGPSKGYWGFTGGHAILGTGGAWSPAILFPYVIWGKIFGWHYWSTAAANVVFLCLVNAAFLKLVRAGRRQTIGLLLLEAVSAHLILYNNTIMSEVLRYALALLLAGLLYRLAFSEEKTGRLFKILTGLYLVLLVQIYIFFVFAVPIYVCGLLRGKSKKKKICCSLAALILVAGASYGLLHLISSNYNIYKTEKLFTALKNRDLGGAVYSALWMAWAGLQDLWRCFLGSTGHGLFHWFVAFLAALLILPLAVLMKDLWRQRSGEEKESRKDRNILICVCYSIVLYTGAYITMYSLEAFTFFQGMGIVVLFSLALLLQMEKRSYGVILLGCYAIGLVFVPANMADFNTERYLPQAKIQEWNELAGEMKQAIQVTDEIPQAVKKTSQAAQKPSNAADALHWENTAVLYTMEPRLICAIPAGIGQNFMMYSDEIVPDAEYLIFSLKKENLRGDWLEQSYFTIYKKYQQQIDANYFIQYLSDDYIIYKQKSASAAGLQELVD